MSADRGNGQNGGDQASRLRELAGAGRRGGLTVAVVSGKGGVGKTNVAVNLAVSLAGRGLRVALVDLDMGLANADVLMNMTSRHTLAQVISGQRTIEDISVPGPGGIIFVPGSSGECEVADLSEFERQTMKHSLRTLAASTDITLLDCGAGVSRNVISFATHADRVVVVTTPQPTALIDAYAVIKTLHREGFTGQIGLFANMVNSRGEARATFDRVSAVSKRFLDYSVADAGYMVHDASVALAVHQRTPFVIRYPGSNASACIAAMAERLARTVRVPVRRGGFFKRVVGLFV